MITTIDKTLFDRLSRWIVFKLDMYFDGLQAAPTPITGAEVVDCSILEELAATNDNPLGTVSTNSIDILLRNINHKYTPTNQNSPYYGKMSLGIPCKVYLGIKDTYEASPTWVAMGTYYTSTWKVREYEQQVNITCHDRFSQCEDNTIKNIIPQKNVQAKDFVRYALSCMGFSAEQCIVDSSLTHMIKYAWINSNSVLSALTELALGTGSYIYMGRDDKVHVEKMFKTRTSVHTLQDATNIKKTDSSYSILQNYSGATVNVNYPTVEYSSLVASLDDIVIAAGQTITLNDIEYSKSPIARIAYVRIAANATNLIEVREITARTWDCDLVLHNPTSAEQVCSVKVFGDLIENSFVACHSQHDTSNVITIKQSLVQDEAFAQTYCTSIAQQLSDDMTPTILVEVRGNPALEVGDLITLQSQSERVQARMLITSSELTYDGGLQGQLSGIIIKEG